tara:strand:- start:301 stop:1800 length:1500 start_codon:yes stop_codon:yes gene_type:complete
MNKVNIYWFKKDLRLIDNEAFYESTKNYNVLPIYIIEKEIWKQETHSYRQWQFCKECLIDLNKELTQIGQPLIIKVGNVVEIFEDLKMDFDIKGIYSHQETGDFLSYKRDKKVKKWSSDNNIPWKEYLQFAVFRGNINRNEWSKLARKHYERDPIENSLNLKLLTKKGNEIPSDDFFEFPKDICKGRLKGGRNEGIKRLNYFFKNKIDLYRTDISSPEKSFHSCSRLSPYISWGCLSMREILKKASSCDSRNTKMFSSRLTWHCHFIQKLETEPELEFNEYHPYFKNIRNNNDFFLSSWSKGNTGYPFLDACMRSLNYNGWINFRMRAMLMSFASYNLWIPWQKSGKILAQKFIDYEPGIHWNQCQMQSGTTSINTNRIYNPIKQGKDHDPKGVFIKKWVPELKLISENYIHEPWLIIDNSEYNLIKTSRYINPIVDIKESSKKARKTLYEISLKKGYWDISKLIYEKHGSRKSLNKRKSYKKTKANTIHKQIELNINI